MAVLAAAVFMWFARRGFDMAAYQEALADPNYRDAIAHFPRLPDSELKPIGMAHQFQVLQGGGHLQLLCQARDPGALWANWKDRFKYTSPGIGSWMIEDPKDLRKSQPLVSLEVGEPRELGPDWVIGVLSVTPGTDHQEEPWNHCDVHGIAVNLQQGLILYWAESW